HHPLLGGRQARRLRRTRPLHGHRHSRSAVGADHRTRNHRPPCPPRDVANAARPRRGAGRNRRCRSSRSHRRTSEPRRPCLAVPRWSRRRTTGAAPAPRLVAASHPAPGEHPAVLRADHDQWAGGPRPAVTDAALRDRRFVMFAKALGVGSAAVVFCTVVIAAVVATVAVYDHAPTPAPAPGAATAPSTEAL